MVIVVAGVAVAALLAVTTGFGTTTVVIFSAVLAFGILAIAVARKAASGAVEPGRCAACGGLVSRAAPYCKHCGARA